MSDVGCHYLDFLFTRETWNINVTFNHLIGRFHNDASSIRQICEVNNQKVNRVETGKCTWNRVSVSIDKLVYLFKGKIEESNNSF